MSQSDAIETLATVVALESVAGAMGETCRNCGAALSGPFCASCGQSVNDRSKSLLKVVGDTLQDLLHFDSRVLRTLASLLVQPGRMTRDYMLGRRTRYVPPLRLYLFSSLIFFITLSFANVALVVIELKRENPQDTAQNAEAEAALERTRQELVAAGADPAVVDATTRQIGGATEREGPTAIRAGGETFTLPPGTTTSLRFFVDLDGWTPEVLLTAAPSPPSSPPSSGGASGDGSPPATPVVSADVVFDDPGGVADRVLGKDWEARALRGIATSVIHPESLNKVLGDNIAKMMFLLMPVYALILAALYWRRKLFFVDHLSFALHVHAFLFTLFTLIVLVRELGGLDVLETGDGAQWLLAIMAGYVWVALKVAYGQGAVRTTVKWLLLGWCYSIVLLFGLGGVFVYSLPDV